jgi:hypothetical protein
MGSQTPEGVQRHEGMIAKEALLAYPDFAEEFVIHTDASHTQLGAVILQLLGIGLIPYLLLQRLSHPHYYNSHNLL